VHSLNDGRENDYMIQVIDQDLILSALHEGAQLSTSDTNDSGINGDTLADTAAKATELRLSFKNVIEIDNLQGFYALRTLRLDNNIIKCMKNLDHLVNLTWLDLSFNRISKVTGLNRLEKLTDLSLFNNMLSEVNGLDQCKNLHCLSLGNNNISALKNIVELRCFQNLRLLNLEGNPVSKESSYRMCVLAYFNELAYLDYSMVTRAEVVTAREQYQDELLDVEEKENFEEEKNSSELAAARHTQTLVDANLTVVQIIFDDMFADDTENLKLRHLPGVSGIMNSFQSEVESASDMFQRDGLARYELKKREETQFELALRQLRAKYANESIDLVTKFGRIKKQTLKSQALKQDVESYDLGPLRVALRELISLLKNLEMRHVEQCEELIGEFEIKYFEVKQACLEGQQGYFRHLEDHETNFIRILTLLVSELLDKAAKDELPGDLPVEISSLLTDRDSCMNAITGSHDVHIGKLYRREDEAKHNEELLFKGALRHYRDEEHVRSRGRISELSDFEGACLNEFSRLTSDRDGDEEAEWCP